MKNLKSIFGPGTICLIVYLIPCCTAEQSTESDINILTNLITQQFKHAWDANDEQLIAAMFLEDADLTFPTSKWIKGKDAIRQAFDRDLAEGLTIDLEIEDIRFLAPNVSVVNVNAHFTGGTDENGHEIPDYWDSATMIMKKENGEWKYSALRVMPSRMDYDEVTAKINNTWDKFIKSAESGDLEGIMSCYTANAINMVPEMDNVNNKESYGMFESFLSNNSFSNISKETLELEVVGPTAYELGFYEDMIKPKNSDPYHRKLRYSAIWKKEPDGNWRWHRFIFNNLPLE